MATLPPPFVWQSIFTGDPGRSGVHLRFEEGGPVVAAVSLMDGRWHVTVNLHRGSHQLGGGFCATRMQGMRWVERWLTSRAVLVTEQLGADKK